MSESTTEVPRLALRPAEAAACIGVSRSFFDDEIAPSLRVIRKGRVVLFPITEIESWLRANREPAVADQVGAAA